MATNATAFETKNSGDTFVASIDERGNLHMDCTERYFEDDAPTGETFARVSLSANSAKALRDWLNAHLG